jgi:uncharacterized membrane protein
MDEYEHSQSKKPIKKHRIIKPSFYIDDERRVICESHSQIERIRSLTAFSDFPGSEATFQLEKLLTCKTCDFYKKDVCYFPKEEIDKIEKDRRTNYFHCKLCGGSIDRPLTIIYSLYNKEKFNVQMPTVCCTCFAALENGSFLKNARAQILKFSSFIILTLIFLYFFWDDIIAIGVDPIGLGLLAIMGAFVLYLIIRDIKSINYLVKGIKYYKKTYGVAKEREKGKYVDDFPFD